MPSIQSQRRHGYARRVRETVVEHHKALRNTWQQGLHRVTGAPDSLATKPVFVGATGYHDVNRGSEERRTGSDRGAHDELHLQHHTTLHPHGTERGLRRPCLGRHSEPLLGPEAADWGWTFMWPGMPFWLQIGSRNADAPQSDSDRIQIVVPRPKISLDSDLREYRTGGSRCPEEGIQKPGPRREPVGRPKRPGFSATREGPLVGPAESHGDAGANAWHRSGGGAAGKKFESISAHR